MYCYQCGNELKEDAAFCAECGTRVEVCYEKAENKCSGATKEKGKKNRVIKVISVAAFFVMVLAAGVAINVYKSRKTINENIKYVHYSNDNELSHLMSVVDENGNEIKSKEYGIDGNICYENKYKYDVNGNKIQKTIFDKEGGKLWEEKYEYDGDGNLTKKITYEDGKNEEAIEEKYKYDEDGNLIKKVVYQEYDQNYVLKCKYRYEYEYDSNGNVIQCTEYYDGSIVHVWNYDDKGNLIRGIGYDEYFDGYMNVAEVEEYEYDANGNLLRSMQCLDSRSGVTDYGLTTYFYERKYDKAGNEIENVEIYNRSSLTNTKKYEHKYDRNGNVRKCICYYNGKISYEREYDSNGKDIKYIKYNDDGSIDYEE